MSIPPAQHQSLNFFSTPFVTELFQRSGCVRRCRSPFAQWIHGQPSRDLGLAEEYVESRALRAAIRPTSVRIATPPTCSSHIDEFADALGWSPRASYRGRPGRGLFPPCVPAVLPKFSGCFVGGKRVP